MPTFDYTFTVDAPLEDVAAFHNSTRALKKLSPPPLFVQLHQFEPLQEGSLAKFTLWFGPFPIRWVAVHNNVNQLYGFTDVQKRGPLKSWRHKHRFERVGTSQTKVIEHIEYEYSDGWAGVLNRLIFSRPALHFLFAYRQHITKREIDAKIKAKG